MSEPDTGNSGCLYLVPTWLGESAVDNVLPRIVLERVHQIDAFVAENAKSARHFLKAAGHPRPLSAISISELNEHTPAKILPTLLAPALAGRPLGLLSEAGCPAVADPGSALVALAHDRGVRVVPLVGPSSLLLALMASGLDGQRFCFHGYLPVERERRDEAIRQIEAASRCEHQTQIFIEAPYRNSRLFQALLEVCQPSTRLCVASHLTLRDEQVYTKTIAQWRHGEPPMLERRPAVFLLLAARTG